MSKKKKDPIAEQLIESLLDESNEAAESSVVYDFHEPKTAQKTKAIQREEVTEDKTVSLASVSKTVANTNTTDTESQITNSQATSTLAIVPPDAEPSVSRSEVAFDASKTQVVPPSEATERITTPSSPSIASQTQSDARYSTNTSKIQVQGVVYSSAEVALKQSENLRIAQLRLSELESEIERLRRENEELAAAGETLRRLCDELQGKSEVLSTNLYETEKAFDEERKVFRGHLAAKDKEIQTLKQKLDEFEHRLEGGLKKIRVRERELEHRLEIVRMESSALVNGKDKMILDLKRQVDQLMQEGDYNKTKSQELYNQYKEKQDTIRRVVRALRIALSILEGDEDTAPLKKAE